MTYREKKEFLEGYMCAQHRIYGLKHELEEWHTIATSITQKLSPVIVNTNEVNSRVEKCSIKCVEIQEQITRELAEAEDRRNEILAVVNKIRDTRRRDIITMRYINNIPIKVIASEYEKDINNIYKMIRTTIKNLPID